MVPIPLIQKGVVSTPNSPNLNLNEKFTLNIVRGDRRTGVVAAVTNAANSGTVFDKPVDNIGVKTISASALTPRKHCGSVWPLS